MSSIQRDSKFSSRQIFAVADSKTNSSRKQLRQLPILFFSSIYVVLMAMWKQLVPGDIEAVIKRATSDSSPKQVSSQFRIAIIAFNALRCMF